MGKETPGIGDKRPIARVAAKTASSHEPFIAQKRRATEANGQMQAQVYPPGGVAETLGLNFAGEVLSSSTTDADDPNGALDGKTWNTSYSYNADAQLTTVTEPSGLQEVTDYFGDAATVRAALTTNGHI